MVYIPSKLFGDRGNRIVKPTDEEVARYGGGISRREFLKYAGKVAAYATAAAAGTATLSACGKKKKSPTQNNDLEFVEPAIFLDETFSDSSVPNYTMKTEGPLNGTFNLSYGERVRLPLGTYKLRFENPDGQTHILLPRERRNVSIERDTVEVGLDAIGANSGLNIPLYIDLAGTKRLAGGTARWADDTRLSYIYATDNGPDESDEAGWRRARRTIDTITGGLLTSGGFDIVTTRPNSIPDNTVLVWYTAQAGNTMRTLVNPPDGPTFRTSEIQIPPKLIRPQKSKNHENGHVTGLGHDPTNSGLMGLGCACTENPTPEEIQTGTLLYLRKPRHFLDETVDRD